MFFDKKKLKQINYILERATPITDRRGVYIGINKPTGDIIYIGKAKDYWKRTPNSLEKEIKNKQDDVCQDYGCSSIAFIPCVSDEEMNEVEKKLIKFYRPYYNKDYNKEHSINYYKNETVRKMKQVFRTGHKRKMLKEHEIPFIISVVGKRGNVNFYNLAKEVMLAHSNIDEHKINKEARELSVFIESQWNFKEGKERGEEEKIERKRVAEHNNKENEQTYRAFSSFISNKQKRSNLLKTF